jgi:hypothetical protein
VGVAGSFANFVKRTQRITDKLRECARMESGESLGNIGRGILGSAADLIAKSEI